MTKASLIVREGSAQTTPRLQHRTLASAIVDQLRRDILDGTLVAGTLLRQDSLAKDFQVSRIPVREALFQLEAEGLVDMRPHKGAVVSTFSKEEIDDVFELRALLEPRLLQQSVPRLTPTDFAELSRLNGAFAVAIGNHDLLQWGRLNAEFHLCLYKRAHHPQTLSIVASLLQSSERFTPLQMNRMPALLRAKSEHHQLLGLCQRGEIDKASDCLRMHIDKVRRDIHVLLRRAERSAAVVARAVEKLSAIR